MAAILNSAIWNSTILESAILVFPLKLTHTCQDWFPPFAQNKTFTHSFWLNLMMAAILNSAFLDSAILHIKNITHSCWLNLMMAAILNSAMLDSDTMFSSLRFTQKHSHSTLTLTQTNSICLTWWWQPTCIQPFCTKKNFTHSFWLNLMMAAILNSALLDSDTTILDPAILDFPFKLTHTYQDWFPPFAQKKTSLIHSDSTWWWQPSWIQPFCTKLWLKLIQSESNSFILTQLDDGGHL